MRTSLFGILLACWVFSTQPVMANFKQQVSSNSSKSAKQERNKISSSQAASIVKSRYGGKILKVQSSSSGYRVKVLKSDGRILSVFVDGQTGRVKG